MPPKPRIFITATYQGTENRLEIEHLCALVRQAGFDDFCFIRDVERYQSVFSNPLDLMNAARAEIERSEYLLIDITAKPTGRAIEAGIAFALGKKVVVIARLGTPLKDTTRGIAAAFIEYETVDDIVGPLSELIPDENSRAPLIK